MARPGWRADTLANAKADCRALGFTLRHDPALGEYQLYPLGGGPTYYTSDRTDAVHTAEALAKAVNNAPRILVA